MIRNQHKSENYILEVEIADNYPSHSVWFILSFKCVRLVRLLNGCDTFT